MLFIVDVQYYCHDSTKILKEACILPLFGPLKCTHFAFKAPLPLEKLPPKDLSTVNFVYHNLGSLHWNEGVNTVEEFISIIPPNAIILCNGLEKSLLLSSLLPLCVVTNVKLSSANITPPPLTICCPTRKHSQCAVLHAFQLYMHLMNN